MGLLKATWDWLLSRRPTDLLLACPWDRARSLWHLLKGLMVLCLQVAALPRFMGGRVKCWSFVKSSRSKSNAFCVFSRLSGKEKWNLTSESGFFFFFFIVWEEFLDQLKNLKQTKPKPKHFKSHHQKNFTAHCPAVSGNYHCYCKKIKMCFWSVQSLLWASLNVLSLQLLFAVGTGEWNMVFHKSANVFSHRTQTSFWQLLASLTGSFPLHRARK